MSKSKLSPKKLIPRLNLVTNKPNSLHKDKGNLRDYRRADGNKVKEFHTSASPMFSEEIVYEFDDDDYESEMKIWTMMDNSVSIDNTTSSEAIITDSQSDRIINDPNLYKYKKRKMFSGPSASALNLHKRKISGSGKQTKINISSNIRSNKNKWFNGLEGDFVSSTFSMNLWEDAGYPKVTASSSKPTSKELVDSSYSFIHNESYDFTPKADESVELFSKNKNRRKFTNNSKVSFALFDKTLF